MKGRVHSVQSLGAVDGPGLRFVVFLQGCPLRCVYCHNPDTWNMVGGIETEAASLVEKALRYQPYFGETGGVTLSGGEPLVQAEFAAELFRQLHEKGIHTALDTAGVIAGEQARQVLQHTDLVLADLKFATVEDYRKYANGDMDAVERFLRLTEEMEIPLWIRHVVVPGLNDTLADMKQIYEKAVSYRNFKKMEWLPFHNMCIEKYQSMDIPFPLADTDNMDKDRLNAMIQQIELTGKKK